MKMIISMVMTIISMVMTIISMVMKMPMLRMVLQFMLIQALLLTKIIEGRLR